MYVINLSGETKALCHGKGVDGRQFKILPKAKEHVENVVFPILQKYYCNIDMFGDWSDDVLSSIPCYYDGDEVYPINEIHIDRMIDSEFEL